MVGQDIMNAVQTEDELNEALPGVLDTLEAMQLFDYGQHSVIPDGHVYADGTIHHNMKITGTPFDHHTDEL
jgi:hypothetical protein